MKLNSTFLATIAALAALASLDGMGVAKADASATQCVRQGTGQLADLGAIYNAHLTYKRANVKAVRKPAGVRVNFVPTQGMNAPLLLRRALCEAKHSDSQHPLAVEGIKLRVEEKGPHFALFIDAPSVAAAKEVLRRIYAQSPEADRPVVYSSRRHQGAAKHMKLAFRSKSAGVASRG